jgi:hypothetical protein
MGHVDDIEDYHIALNLDQQLYQRTYNAPLTSEVAAVWIEGSELLGQFQNVFSCRGRIGPCTDFGVMMHYHIHFSSPEGSSVGIIAFQRLA